jgi:two-component system OmpR family response regulator
MMAVDPVASPRKVCIIDDDGEYGAFLADFLRVQQMDVDLFRSGTDFLAGADVAAYEFFVVDLGLPGVDGVELISLIRARSNAGLIIISGRMGPDAFNAGLSAGADMFLNKPVRFDQVLQAIRTVSLRVARGGGGATVWSLDAGQSELKCSNAPNVKLTPLELRILQALAAHGAQGCDRKTLLERLGEDQNAARNIDAAIFRLRKKIESATRRAAPIRTLHGVGYSLTGDVRL